MKTAGHCLLILILVVSAGVARAQTPRWEWAVAGLSATTNSSNNFTKISTAVSPDGGAYLAGIFYDTVQFGDTVYRAHNRTDFFISKISAAGQVEWMELLDGEFVGFNGKPITIRLDGRGHLVVTGFLHGFANDTLRFGNYQIHSSDYEVKGYLARLNLVTRQWDQPVEFQYTMLPYWGSISLDGDGDAFLMLDLVDSIQIGNQTLISEGNHDVAICKYDFDAATWAWAKRFGNDGQDIGSDIAIDSDGNVIIVAGSSGTTWLDSLELYDPGLDSGLTGTGQGIMIAKLRGSDGAVQWGLKTRQPVGYTEAYQAVLAPTGALYLTGRIDSMAVFGNTILTVPPHENTLGFVARFDINTQTFAWANPISYKTINYTVGFLGLDGQENPYLGGDLKSTPGVIWEDSIPNPNNFSCYLARLNEQTGEWQAVETFGNPYFVLGNFCFSDSGNVYAVGLMNTNVVDTIQIGSLRVHGEFFLAKLSGFASPGTITLAQFLNDGSFQTYPNPATSTLYITGPTNITTAQLIDPMGRTVRTISLPKSTAETSISVSGLPPGLYTLRCGTEARKIVIE